MQQKQLEHLVSTSMMLKKQKKTRIVVGCHTAKENLEIVGKLQYANKKRKLVTQARWWRPGIISK